MPRWSSRNRYTYPREARSAWQLCEDHEGTYYLRGKWGEIKACSQKWAHDVRDSEDAEEEMNHSNDLIYQ